MKKLKYGVYCVLRFFVRLFYHGVTVEGLENLPEEPCILAGNHSQMYGPIMGELYFPGEPYIWCAHQMMELREVPAYTQYDFWRRKPKWSQWFYKLLSYFIAPFSVCLFGCARTIPVYRDGRLLNTFRMTQNKLLEGKNVIIFPEHDAPHNRILCDFQEGFVDIARGYYKKTGKCLPFVPLYIAPKLKKAYLGKPIYYCPENPGKEERRRVCDRLMAEITEISLSLPRHLVVPYNNLPKKEYVYNIPEEVSEHEKTGG